MILRLNKHLAFLERFKFRARLRGRRAKLRDALFFLFLGRLLPRGKFALKLVQHALPVLLVHLGHDVGRVVDHALQALHRHVEHEAYLRRDAAQEPDVADRRGKIDVAHALAANDGARHLNAALVADHALVADAAVLAAITFPVLGGTENALGEETVLLGALGAIVDRLGLRHLAVGPAQNVLG